MPRQDTGIDALRGDELCELVFKSGAVGVREWQLFGSTQTLKSSVSAAASGDDADNPSRYRARLPLVRNGESGRLRRGY
jgi:hypothetical protein